MAGFTPTVRMTVPVRQPLPRSAVVVPRVVPGNYGEVAPGSVRLPPSFAGITPVTYYSTVPAAQREFLSESARIARELEEFNDRPAPTPKELKAVVRKTGNKTVKVSRRKILAGLEDTTSVRNEVLASASAPFRGTAGVPSSVSMAYPTANPEQLPPAMQELDFQTIRLAHPGLGSSPSAPIKVYEQATPEGLAAYREYKAQELAAAKQAEGAAAQRALDEQAATAIEHARVHGERYEDLLRAFSPEGRREYAASRGERLLGKLAFKLPKLPSWEGFKRGVSTAVGSPVKLLAAADSKSRETLPGYIVSRIWHSKDPTGRRDRLWKFLGKHPATTTTTATGLATVGYLLAGAVTGARALEEGDRVAAKNSAERGDAYNKVTNRLVRLERDAGEIASGSVSQDNQLREMGRYAGQMSGIGEALLEQLDARLKAAGDDAQARTNAMLRAAADYSAAYRVVEEAMGKAGAANLLRRWNDDIRAAGRTVSPEDFARGIGLKEVPDGR